MKRYVQTSKSGTRRFSKNAEDTSRFQAEPEE